MQSRIVNRAAVACATAAVAIGGAFYVRHGVVSPARAATADPAPPPAVTAGGAPDFTAIVRQYGPAVVNVSTVGVSKTVAVDPSLGQGDPDDPMFQFFKHFGAPMQRQRGPVRGVGSGFIVRPDGVVLTNAHVVEGANEVTVKLTDKREYRAKVLGKDKDTDIAVLKIDAKDLPTVRIGDSSRTQVGEWVLAIGSPFGFENSATAGIVSARARSLPGEGYVPFIQTDVAVNPGNSGGPLFDVAGDVIGVNSQIYTGSGGYMGVSFAIPIDTAMNVERQILDHGKVVRARMGVTVQEVNQQLADSFGLSRPTGALVSAVENGSPAAHAGITPGDIILAVNGHDITSSGDLPPRIASLKPGDKVHVELWREGSRQRIDLELGSAGESAVASAAEPSGSHGRLGLAIRPLTPEEQRQAGVEGGALVENVTGPAARAGVQPGDVVLAVNGRAVKSVDQLRGLVRKAHARVALLVKRGEARMFVPIELG